MASINKLGFRKTGQKSRATTLFNSLVSDVLDEVKDNQEESLTQLGYTDFKTLENYTKELVRAMLKQYFHQEQRRV